jgi:beta-glucanase (GH16 family)
MEVYITPPIPTRRGIVIGKPGSYCFIEEKAGPMIWDDLKQGKLSDKGEMYFPVKATGAYRVHCEGLTFVVDAWNTKPVFNSTFKNMPEGPLPSDGTWQTRGTTYLKGKSDYAKADPQCANIEGGRLVLRVMEGETDGTFITGHVGTGEVNKPARFAFTHGWASAKIKFHPLRGALSGFWGQFCSGVYSELDVVEYGGTKNADGKGGTVHHTVWWDSDGLGARTSKSESTDKEEIGKDFDTDRLVYSVNWQPDFYDFWINTRRVARITQGLSNEPKFLVASILVRNYQLDDMLANLGQIKTFADEYDWIRVWK